MHNCPEAVVDAVNFLLSDGGGRGRTSVWPDSTVGASNWGGSAKRIKSIFFHTTINWAMADCISNGAVSPNPFAAVASVWWRRGGSGGSSASGNAAAALRRRWRRWQLGGSAAVAAAAARRLRAVQWERGGSAAAVVAAVAA